ncbi:MAG: hypothetical protein L3K16_00085 [Thermoplasmata archaeon]|nr:hypothetical protein [Thermoplasmata archaeon]
MGGKVVVQVRQADGSPVPGARLLAINHDAWSKAHKEWHGTTDTTGDYTWPNMDTGTLGDRYTFTAAFEDGKAKWAGESSHRIKGDTTIVLTLTKAND